MIEFKMTLDRIEEIALCIVHNELSEDEAVAYAKNVLLEHNGIETDD